MRPKRVLSIFGTRPEAIKMAPVLRALASRPEFDSKICVTAQHRSMLDQALELFGIHPHHDLNVMSPGQDLFELTSRALLGLREVIREESPDVVLVQGDTTTCFAGALASFYEGVAVAHVEAGLRTGNLRAPFPEEANRAMVGRIAELHFAPTDRSRRNLLAENVPQARILVTGNTVIDALLWVRERVSTYPDSAWKSLFGERLFACIRDTSRRCVLITGHRRESFGQGFRDLCHAIRELAVRHSDWDLIYPVHMNPNVRKPVNDVLAGLPNVHLIEPLDYAPFVWLMNESDLILTDSGGVQEEAPSLGKPVLVTREVTERPEAVEAGTVRLVGVDKDRIIDATEELLQNADLYARMSHAHNPYGDGRAAERIVEALAG